MGRPTRYPREWRWPNGAKIAVSLGLAIEDFRYKSQVTTESAASKVNHFSLSFGDYGWKTGIWRLMDLADEFGVKANVTVNGRAAERHPDVIAEVVKAGHEIAGHGWENDILMSDEDPEAERREIRRCTEALEKTGQRPVGWTSPGSAGSENTFSILKEEGYLWCGDDASDDIPFVKATPAGPIVMMPRTNLFQNDLFMWSGGRNPPSVIWENFKDAFDELYAEGVTGTPKWTELTIHAHIGARPNLIPTARKCLAYASQHEGVWFARRRDIAEWTLQQDKGGAR